MAVISAIKTSLNNPNVMFTQDILADPSVAPQLFEEHRSPTIRIYARGEGPGNPDIVTPRTEAYIITWEEKDPSVWE